MIVKVNNYQKILHLHKFKQKVVQKVNVNLEC